MMISGWRLAGVSSRIAVHEHATIEVELTLERALEHAKSKYKITFAESDGHFVHPIVDENQKPTGAYSYSLRHLRPTGYVVRGTDIPEYEGFLYGGIVQATDTTDEIAARIPREVEAFCKYIDEQPRKC